MIAWKDSLFNGYIHRPVGEKHGKNFEDMCSYEMSMTYAKKYLIFSQMARKENKCDKVGFDEGDHDIISPS